MPIAQPSAKETLTVQENNVEKNWKVSETPTLEKTIFLFQAERVDVAQEYTKIPKKILSHITWITHSLLHNITMIRLQHENWFLLSEKEKKLLHKLKLPANPDQASQLVQTQLIAIWTTYDDFPSKDNTTPTHSKSKLALTERIKFIVQHNFVMKEVPFTYQPTSDNEGKHFQYLLNEVQADSLDACLEQEAVATMMKLLPEITLVATLAILNFSELLEKEVPYTEQLSKEKVFKYIKQPQ